jgi:hypothetical protein
MTTTIAGAQSPNTSAINIPETTPAELTEPKAPVPQPTDSQADARQTEASKQSAGDIKAQNDARAGYIKQQLNETYKNSMPAGPHQFVADKNGVSGGTQAAPAKTSNVNAKQTTTTKQPETYDISKVTPQQIQELRDKKQYQLANTIENAEIAYHDFVKANPGVKVIVTTSEGNGGKPVLVVKGAKADKDAHVHTHYHGDNATVADPLGSKAGQNARIRDTLMKDPHAVFVLPEAANSSDEHNNKTDSSMNDNKYSVSWSNVKNQVKTTNDALEAAGVQRPPKESVVSFHSGGGMALVNLVNNNKDKGNATLQADRLELYDCVYHFGEKEGKPLPAYHFEQRFREWSQTDSGKAVKQVVFYRGSNDVSRAAVMEKAVGKDKFKTIDMKDEPPVDDTINPPAENANGNWMEIVRNGEQTGKVARNFNPDRHYRTVGQFMGTRPRP